jgi:hypothetical protein
MRLLLAVVLVSAACGGGAGLTASASPSPAASPLSVVELKFRLFQLVGRPWYCDTDFYPIARADERDLARQRLPEMQQDAETYYTILRRLSLPPTPQTWTDGQLLAVYRDWKDLRALALDPTGPAGVYGAAYLVRPGDVTAGQGDRVEVRIDVTGKVNVLSKVRAGPPNCPICLAATTRVDTPSGPVRVTDLHVGDVVWTLDATGARIAAPLTTVANVDAPAGHEVLRIALADGRVVTASPGHPTADGRTLGSISVGDLLDGSIVVSIVRLPYRGRTYDVLPARGSGAYWADGVLLGSTLAR